MFIVGDVVEILDSAEIDICGCSWPYVKEHRQAVVKGKCDSIIYKNVKEEDKGYIVEWPEEFPGGWDCGGVAAKKRGQMVAAKHLEMNFEESFRASQRAIVTVPNIGEPHGKT